MAAFRGVAAHTLGGLAGPSATLLPDATLWRWCAIMSTISTVPTTPSSRASKRPKPSVQPLRTQLVTLGEAMLRLSVRPGNRLEDAPAFDVHVAGAEANVAFAAARVGLRAAWVSALPSNPLGRRVAATLGAAGVDTANVRWVEGGRLGLYFVELGAAPRPISVLYDRARSAIAEATPDLFDWESISNTEFFHLSGITLGLSAGCSEIAVRAMQEARRHAAVVTFDINHRQRLWPAEAAALAIRSVAPLIDILVCTTEDARDLFGATGAPEAVVDRLHRELDVDTVVLTLGADGAIARQGGKSYQERGHLVETIDRVGAGDAFVAGLIWGLLDGSLNLGLQRGLAMSALKMTLHGDLFRLGAADVAALINRDRREVGR
jgi:2-dehydro-3-deoxygluconokinase